MIDHVHIHSDTARDTPELEGTKSSFPVKVHLIPGKTPATYKIFCGATVVQKGKRKMQVFESQALAFCWVPGAGIEPARIAPLVFETSASTDSAIRAGVLFRLPVGVWLRIDVVRSLKAKTQRRSGRVDQV